MPQPIILEDMSGLGQGISAFGSALGDALKKRGQAAQQKQYGNILETTLGELSQDSSPIDITRAFSSAVSQGVPIDTVRDYGSLLSTLQTSQSKLPPGPQQIGMMSTLFQKFGMPEEEAQKNAELWGKLTTGGKTEMAKLLVDQISRQQYSKNSGNSVFGPEEVVSEEEVENFDFPKVDIFEDRTPKEKSQLKSQLLKDNNNSYVQNSEKLQNIDKEILRYDQLERLNDSGKLPQGLQNLNINWTTGDIRYPKLANPETQQFVKTVNDFTIAAKDTFGARVTNFELGSFMKRLATLANTEGGRRVILDQMKAMKSLDRLYNDSIKQVYDHYGMQNIDRASVERIAAQLRKDDEDKLKQDFANSVKAQEINDARARAPEGKMPAISPDGKVVYIWINSADKAEQQGFKLL